MASLTCRAVARSTSVVRLARRGLATIAEPNAQQERSSARKSDFLRTFAFNQTGKPDVTDKRPKAVGGSKSAPQSIVYNTIPLAKQRWSTIMLRDMCTCPQCVDPSSKQKNFLTSDIPAAIEGNVVEENENSVTIEWTNDIPTTDGRAHTTTLAWSTLLKLLEPRRQFPKRKLWVADEFSADTTDFAYKDYMENDETLLKVLLQLKVYGLAFLSGVPELEESVAKIAERVGPLRNSLYGLTWDVRSVPEALNVAYTSKDLGFHMDLLPFTSPPALQFLHCVRTSAKGGSSLFMDSCRAAQDLADTDANAHRVLGKVPVPYHYDHPGSHRYTQSWNATDTRHSPVDYTKAGEVRWSPPFQGPMSTSLFSRRFKPDTDAAELVRRRAELLAEWHDAAGKFNALIHKPEGIVERMMKPGECVLFENTRVLHARTAFEANDAGKERWLRGAYVDSEPWESKMRVLQQQYGAAEV